MKRSARLRGGLQHVLAAAVGFLLTYLLVAFVVLPDDVTLGDVTVPGVVGLTQTDAERRLASLGLKSALGASRFSADAPKSTVLSQVPAGGSVVASGSVVTLDVSAGQQRATIPSVLGRTREDAEGELRAAGLQLGQLAEEASDSARGLILASSPSEGQVVPLGTRVDLVISAGPAELTMPDVVGRDLDSANALIAQLGLSSAPVTYDSITTLPRGTVVAQSPAAGERVSAGTAITLRVSGTP